MTTEEPGPASGCADPAIEIADSGHVASAPASWYRWELAAGLLILSVLGTAAILPYSLSLLRQAKDSVITTAIVPVIVVVSLLIEGVMSAVAIAIGIGLGRRAGLGPYLLEGIDGCPDPDESTDGQTIIRSRSRAWKAIALGAALGLILGAVIVGCSYALESSMPEMGTKIEHPPPLEGLLASFGAGIREEVWLRLGLMTLLAWLGTVIARREPGNSAVIWTANVMAALSFGAMHLPQAAMLIGLNAAVVGFVFVGNGVPGIAFGWLFWRKGLLAAMVSHFVLDVVLKVILPAMTA